MNIFDKSVVSSSSQTAEQSGSAPAPGVADAVAPLLSDLIQGSGTPLFPQLSQAFKGLFDAIQPGQQFSAQTSPFSPTASGIPNALFNNPSQLADLLGKASRKLSDGVPSRPLADKEAVLNMQVAVEQAFALMNTRGQKQNEAIDNSVTES